MSGAIAVSEVFYAAFRSLARGQRERVLGRLLRDRDIQEDLFDLALIDRARRVKGRAMDARVFFKRLASKASH